MNLTLHTSPKGFTNSLVGVDKQGNLSTSCEVVKKTFTMVKDAGLFHGEKDQLYTTMAQGGDSKKIITFIGLGENLDTEDKQKAYGKAVKVIKQRKVDDLFASILANDEKEAALLCETLLLANYEFDKYFSEKKHPLKKIGVLESNVVNAKSVAEAQRMADATLLARDLVNEPANVLVPVKLAEEAKKAGEKFNFKVEVFSEDYIREKKMDAFLSVSQGSVNEPKLIVMHYVTDESKPKLALVGKGLTYDSGGFSLKPSEGMDTMKCDMGGAAAVIGAMCALAQSGAKANVVAIVATCENILSAKAYKPGDIIGSMLGKTIEVGNTDAEGRLTLADAVTYAVKEQGAETIVDIATLTGAAMRALGDTYSAIVTKEDNLYEALQTASAFSGNKVWHLPADRDYFESLRSKVADINNIGSPYGGAMQGGLFIEYFTCDKPFLHIDIAGPAWAEKDTDLCPKGGTGVGAAMLYQLVKILS